MATILFWNIGKRQLQYAITTLCREHEVDVLILAEVNFAEEPFLRKLNTGYARKYLRPLNNSLFLRFFTRYPSEFFVSVADEGRISVRLIRPPLGLDFNLVAVHLPSKLWMKDYDQAAEARRLAEVVKDAETKSGHKRTIVIGDFNMNPFEDGLIAADGLHSIMDRRVAQRLGRTVQDTYYPYLYNPMFSFMGDLSSGPPGTYFYDTPGMLRLFWNTFDQILVRPALSNTFDKDDIAVLTKCGEESLLDHEGVPDKAKWSDHLPLLFKFKIERMEL